MVRSTAKGNDQCQDHNTNNDDDLETGQPELKFTEEADTKVVDANNNDEEYGDPYSRIDLVARQPVLDDQSSGGKLVGCYDDVFEPVTVGTNSISQGLLSSAFSVCLLFSRSRCFSFSQSSPPFPPNLPISLQVKAWLREGRICYITVCK